MSEDVFFNALLLICGTVVVFAALRFYRRVLELKHERRIPIQVDELQKRLQRIELAVDSTAIEVERISEANRFMSKLLADRPGAVHLVSKPEPVITPH
jgi:Na+/phosphate symporter